MASRQSPSSVLMRTPTNAERLTRCDNDPMNPPFVGACWGPQRTARHVPDSLRPLAGISRDRGLSSRGRGGLTTSKERRSRFDIKTVANAERCRAFDVLEVQHPWDCWRGRRSHRSRGRRRLPTAPLRHALPPRLRPPRPTRPRGRPTTRPATVRASVASPTTPPWGYCPHPPPWRRGDRGAPLPSCRHLPRRAPDLGMSASRRPC